MDPRIFKLSEHQPVLAHALLFSLLYLETHNEPVRWKGRSQGLGLLGLTQRKKSWES